MNLFSVDSTSSIMPCCVLLFSVWVHCIIYYAWRKRPESCKKKLAIFGKKQLILTIICDISVVTRAVLCRYVELYVYRGQEEYIVDQLQHVQHRAHLFLSLTLRKQLADLWIWWSRCISGRTLGRCFQWRDPEPGRGGRWPW